MLHTDTEMLDWLEKNYTRPVGGTKIRYHIYFVKVGDKFKSLREAINADMDGQE
jgi:hypothetical protein